MPTKKNVNKKSNIKKIKAREILDSRGNPTLEIKIELENGAFAKAAVPSGASTGIHEANEKRDGDKKRYAGQGVLEACENVNKKIAKKLVGVDVLKQKDIDNILIKLDGTKDKSKLGGNAMIGVSLACCRAGSVFKKKSLPEYIAKVYGFDTEKTKIPVPMFNIFNGGRHADTNLDIQELMVSPIGIKKFKEQLRAGAEIFHELGVVLKENGYDTDLGNEGGYAPNISSTMQAIDFIMEAISRAGYKAGEEIGLGTDIGASELYHEADKLYRFDLEDNYFIADQLISLYRDWSQKYPFFMFEDGLAEDDWENWEDLMKEFERFKPLAKGEKMMIVGDDLVTTNKERLEAAIKRKACNAVILKPNQIGTLTESIDFVKLAQKNKIKIITSHRSGETNDDFIADLAVAIGSEFVKFGAPSRGERLVKYNRLLEIEDKF
jgi:enolase